MYRSFCTGITVVKISEIVRRLWSVKERKEFERFDREQWSGDWGIVLVKMNYCLGAKEGVSE